jgi:hypothetical protein
MEHLSSLTTQQIADGICLRAGRIAAAQAELLTWIAEFDRREGWSGQGLLSCAHWLSWRIGLSLPTAREQVRVARRLEELPRVAEAFLSARVSYSKVRAITRTAEPDDSIDWVALARHSSAAQLEALARGVRRARAHAREVLEPEASAEGVLRTRTRYNDDGSFSITISGPAELLPVIQAGIEAKKAQLQRESNAAVADRRESAGVAASIALADGPSDDASAEASEAVRITDAEALLALARDALAVEQTAHPEMARRRRPQLTVQVDPLSGWARQVDGELLPPTSLRAVEKTLPGRDGTLRLRPLREADLRRHDLGRTRREASAALRELLGTIDGERCRFPGCRRRRKLHAHHVVYWSAGGCTDLENLVLVCGRHHTLVHSQGFFLVLHADRRLEVRDANGVAVVHHPAQPWGDPRSLAEGCGQHVSAEALPPDHVSARLDLGYAVSVLLAQAS